LRDRAGKKSVVDRAFGQVRFSWRPGSVAFWDNRAAVHYAVQPWVLGEPPRAAGRAARRPRNKI
jgi:hypothetical protein